MCTIQWEEFLQMSSYFIKQNSLEWFEILKTLTMPRVVEKHFRTV